MKNQLLSVFDFRFNRATLLKPSVIALIAANLFPVFGVIFLGWEVFLILLLFWMENLVIGLYTILKMAFASPDNVKGSAKASIIPFFCIHYGIFTLVHGVFVFVLFGENLTGEYSLDIVSTWQAALSYQVAWGGLVLLVSHGVSFFHNYIGAGEYKKSELKTLMIQPYGRVIILHLTIIFGGFLVMLFGSPVAGLMLLIILKTFIDIRSHLREHAKYGVQKPAIVN